MRTLNQVRAVGRVLPRARRNRTDALVASARTDSRLKMLAKGKAAALIQCEYCMDIGSAIARGAGIDEGKLRHLTPAQLVELAATVA